MGIQSQQCQPLHTSWLLIQHWPDLAPERMASKTNNPVVYSFIANYFILSLASLLKSVRNSFIDRVTFEKNRQKSQTREASILFFASSLTF